MKRQNSFRDYTAESALFVRRALVAFLGILLLTGVLIANLYNLQILRFYRLPDPLERKPYQAGANCAKPRDNLRP
ncbi:penicillin-binding protein 2 [Salmonella enterica subsp. arizonae]|uniref:Penicillin-binding protein 2 n=1 Tax=Salmonella enterica subsp. arizonae TaxID=59203 RepID=A0A379TE12_SALER|nr:penicillin-binding protein 2 [Salmonella enterica subsp. arizonae]